MDTGTTGAHGHLDGPERERREAELRERAAAFVDEVLLPLEVPAELAGGRLPAADVERIRKASLAARVHGGRHAVAHGGNGWTTREWFLVEEQLGRSTNGLSWYVPNAYNVWQAAGPGLVERWLVPALRGELHDAYAVTEADAGSDPSQMTTTARLVAPGRWVLDGEKWFVTFGSVAAVVVVMAWAVDGTAGGTVDGTAGGTAGGDPAAGHRRPTLFAVPADAPGVEVVADPPFTHAFPHGHPTMRFTGVELTDADVIGDVGAGEQIQRRWFTEERLAIAARCSGAMQRLLEEGVAWAAGRVQGGARLLDHQGVSFPLADSAADAAAGRLLAFDVADRIDAGADEKLVHGRASMAKLFCSEAANRCADRVLQVFGGRGYVRTTAAERLWRELRVDRIWEGTSEVQRIIVARSLERRGVRAMLR
jgi:acyl-CoA dehydrogenase